MTNAQLSANYMRALPGGEFLSMWEGFFATTEWSGGKLKENRIYPIDLNPAPDKPKGPPAFAFACGRQENPRGATPHFSTVRYQGANRR